LLAEPAQDMSDHPEVFEPCPFGASLERFGLLGVVFRLDGVEKEPGIFHHSESSDPIGSLIVLEPGVQVPGGQWLLGDVGQ
jgi:hypothetical protein